MNAMALAATTVILSLVFGGGCDQSEKPARTASDPVPPAPAPKYVLWSVTRTRTRDSRGGGLGEAVRDGGKALEGNLDRQTCEIIKQGQVSGLQQTGVRVLQPMTDGAYFVDLEKATVSEITFECVPEGKEPA